MSYLFHSHFEPSVRSHNLQNEKWSRNFFCDFRDGKKRKVKMHLFKWLTKVIRKQITCCDSVSQSLTRFHLFSNILIRLTKKNLSIVLVRPVGSPYTVWISRTRTETPIVSKSVYSQALTEYFQCHWRSIYGEVKDVKIFSKRKIWRKSMFY